MEEATSNSKPVLAVVLVADKPPSLLNTSDQLLALPHDKLCDYLDEVPRVQPLDHDEHQLLALVIHSDTGDEQTGQVELQLPPNLSSPNTV